MSVDDHIAAIKEHLKAASTPTPIQSKTYLVIPTQEESPKAALKKIMYDENQLSAALILSGNKKDNAWDLVLREAQIITVNEE